TDQSKHLAPGDVEVDTAQDVVHLVAARERDSQVTRRRDARFGRERRFRHRLCGCRRARPAHRRQPSFSADKRVVNVHGSSCSNPVMPLRATKTSFASEMFSQQFESRYARAASTLYWSALSGFGSVLALS